MTINMKGKKYKGRVIRTTIYDNKHHRTRAYGKRDFDDSEETEGFWDNMGIDDVRPNRGMKP